MAVTFDGPNKLIIVDNLVTSLDAQVDLYSDWKEWVITEDNAKYLQAFRTVAGDPVSGTQVVSPYFFITNGWLIRPYEGDHVLSIVGNLYGDDQGGGAQDIITPTLGAYTVNVLIERSVNSLTTTVSGGGGSTVDYTPFTL